MIEPEQDGAQAPGRRRDRPVGPGPQLFAAVRVDRRGGEPRGALVVADGEVTDAPTARAVEVGDATRSRWRRDRGAPRVRAARRSRPRRLTAPAPRRSRALRAAPARQLCEVEGTLARGGQVHARCGGQACARTSWGDAARRGAAALRDGGHRRGLACCTSWRVRPAAATPHGDELVAAQIADAQSDNGRRRSRRCGSRRSTARTALPRTAGARAVPARRRVSRAPVGRGRLRVRARARRYRVAISFFSWTLVGRPAWGTYEIEPSP